MKNSATVTVGSNVAGGSTNAKGGTGGSGVVMNLYYNNDSSHYSEGTLTVRGSVTGSARRGSTALRW